jgi:diadenosine tetraphosphate (Ap4A) HIT family hydrolase
MGTSVEPDCPFCAIASAHKPYSPSSPPPPDDLSPTRTSPPSFLVLSTPSLIAFLDILPLSPGHLLVCPRPHRPKLTDATPAEARRLGAAVRVLSEALARATGVRDWNVVQNNGAAAAQVVPHMHYHLIPRPDIRARGRYSESFTMFGRGKREELDDDEAQKLAAEIRRQVAIVLSEEADQLDDDFELSQTKL